MEQFIKRIEKPTLVLMCNDCQCLQSFCNVEQCKVITIFGGFVQENDLNQLSESIRDTHKSSLDILLIGHCKCQLQKRLYLTSTYTNYWQQIEELATRINTNSKSNKTGETQFTIGKLHLLMQIQKISQNPLFSDKIATGKLTIKGAMINEFDNNKMIELFQPCVLPMSLNLN